MSYKPFPTDALPEVIRCFAREGERVLCVDPAMLTLPMLSIAGAAIGNNRRAHLNDDYLAPPVIWTAVVCASGERKSPVLKAVMQPIHQRQAELAEQHAQARADYDAKRKGWKATPKEQRGDEPDPPAAFPHLYLSDTTVEAIALRLTEQPRGLIVVHDELAGWFKSFNAYKQRGADRESYLAFFDASAAKIDRKSAVPPTIFIPRAFIAVAGMIQPGVLRSVLGPGEFDSGLAARFLIAQPPSRPGKWTAEGITHEVRDGWRNVVLKLLALPMRSNEAGAEPIPLPLTEAAMRRWAEVYDRLSGECHREPDERLRAAGSKLIGYIPRLALVLQLTAWASGESGAGDDAIDERSIGQAIELVEWFGGETRRLYGLLGESDESRRRRELREWIAHRGGRVTVRDMQRNLRRYEHNPEQAEKDLTDLADDGCGSWEYVGSGMRGHPTHVFCLADSPDFPITASADADTNAKNNGKSAIPSASAVSAGEE